jgi:hypothetical protein
MPDEKSLFQTSGPSWGERASLGGLEAVLSPTGQGRWNVFLHGIHSWAAGKVRRRFSVGAKIVDFGYGN